MIRRDMEKTILKYFDQYPILSLIGPRQSGKTTLAKYLFPDLDYVNLEDIEIREFALEDPKGFLDQYGDGLIIDEIQRAPNLFSYLQIKADSKKRNGLYVLTGSQNFTLMESISQTLAGRVAILELLPLSLSELSSGESGIERVSPDHFMFKGFYPKLYNEDADVSFYYRNYIRTYLERDVRQIKNVGNLNRFRNFLVLCASRTGQILNLSSLADDCGINYKTASEWLSVLEAGFIVYLLKPYYKNYKKRTIKSPKIYFYDTGLLCSLLNIKNEEQLKSHYLRGGIFESFIISEFKKQRHNAGLEEDMYFWRDKRGNEVDLLLDRGERSAPVEIKAGKTVSDDYFRGLDYYNKISGNTGENSYVIYSGEEKQDRKKGKVRSWRFIFDLSIERKIVRSGNVQ